MKKYFRKLNQIGAAHLLAPLLVTALIAGVGVYVLNKSRAATLVRTSYSTTPLLFSQQDYTNPAKAIYSIKTVTAEGTSPLTQAEQTSDKYWLSSGKYDPAKSQIAYAETPKGSANSRITVKPLNRVGITPPKVYSNGVGELEDFIWSPDGKRIIYQTTQLTGNVVKFKALDVKTGSVTELATVSILSGGVIWGVSGFDMLGDNQSIVYNLGNSIYQVKTNSSVSSPAEDNGGNCRLVGRRPGTTTEFAYTCYNESARNTSVYTKTLTTAEKLVYASPAWSWNNGTTNKYLDNVAWSQNGAQLALSRANETVIDSETCLRKIQPSMDVINADGTGFRTLANTDASQTVGPGCGGAGGGREGQELVWSKGGSIAVITRSTTTTAVKVVGPTDPYNVATVFKLPNSTAMAVNHLDW
ncbi:MAG TPA: hypothetical protein PKA02_01340 [Candidatus Saccharibacteria bacterium]|nr:hypothetical protein [Candidatus Saccharibacteria bacterium]